MKYRGARTVSARQIFFTSSQPVICCRTSRQACQLDSFKELEWPTESRKILGMNLLLTKMVEYKFFPTCLMTNSTKTNFWIWPGWKGIRILSRNRKSLVDLPQALAMIDSQLSYSVNSTTEIWGSTDMSEKQLRYPLQRIHKKNK